LVRGIRYKLILLDFEVNIYFHDLRYGIHALLYSYVFFISLSLDGLGIISIIGGEQCSFNVLYEKHINYELHNKVAYSFRIK